MAIYDTEEEQLEQLKRWWQANQSSVLLGVVGAAAVITAVNFWQRHQLTSRGQASEMYQQMLNAAAKNDVGAVEKVAEQLSVEYGSSAYAHYAALELAKVKVEKGDPEAAKVILQKEIKTVDSDELRHVARLRLIQLMLADKEYEAGLKLIAEVDPASSEGFTASYDELQGDLYAAMDRQDEARSAYQSAIRTGRPSPLAQLKLDDIAAPALDPAAAKK